MRVDTLVIRCVAGSLVDLWGGRESDTFMVAARLMNAASRSGLDCDAGGFVLAPGACREVGEAVGASYIWNQRERNSRALIAANRWSMMS